MNSHFWVSRVNTQLLDCWDITINLHLTLQETDKRFPVWLYHFAFPSAMCESSTYSAFLSARVIASIFYFSHSNSLIVYFHGFNFHLPSSQWYWISFHMFICHPYIVFSELSVHVCYPCFKLLLCFLLLSFEYSLYLLYQCFLEYVIYKYLICF